MAGVIAHRGGSGTPMVCLHGMMDTWRTWDSIRAGLEAHHDVLMLALPGHMYGPPLPEVASLTAGAIADVIEAELDRAGLTTAHLVGNSLGGWLALELAARERARSVVALSPAGGWYRHTRAERSVLRFFEVSYRRARLIAPVAGEVARLPGARTIGLRRVVSRPSNMPVAAFARMIRGAAACSLVVPALRIAATEGWEDPLGPIGCPVRIAWGTRDRIVPYGTSSERFRALVPDAEFVELEGLGHLPMTDDPDAVLESILGFTGPVDSTPAEAPPPVGQVL